jgi:hypothetical protein
MVLFLCKNWESSPGLGPTSPFQMFRVPLCTRARAPLGWLKPSDLVLDAIQFPDLRNEPDGVRQVLPQRVIHLAARMGQAPECPQSGGLSDQTATCSCWIPYSSGIASGPEARGPPPPPKARRQQRGGEETELRVPAVYNIWHTIDQN